MSKNEVPQIKVEILQSWPFEAQEYILALQTYLQELPTQVAELKNQLNQNSQNSSQPPSAASPFKRPPQKTGESTPNPRGGQVGHTRHSRELVPLEQVDAVIELYPQDCGHCHAPLHCGDQVGEPLRHQVWELPVVKATVKE